MTTNTMPQRGPQRPSFVTQQVPAWLAHAVGVVVLVIGLLLLGFSLLGVFRWLSAGHAVARSAPRPALVMALAIVPMIGLLCTLVGKRLVTGRSPHGDSLLSRTVWTLVGVAFVVMGAGFVVSLPWNSDLGIPLLASALFATGCFGVAFRPGR